MTGPGSRPTAGIGSFASGVVTAGSVSMIALTSLLPGFNPPGWVRIATMAPLPVALIASFALGAVALSKRSGRGWAVAGMAVSGLALVSFAALMATQG